MILGGRDCHKILELQTHFIFEQSCFTVALLHFLCSLFIVRLASSSYTATRGTGRWWCWCWGWRYRHWTWSFVFQNLSQSCKTWASGPNKNKDRLKTAIFCTKAREYIFAMKKKVAAFCHKLFFLEASSGFLQQGVEIVGGWGAVAVVVSWRRYVVWKNGKSNERTEKIMLTPLDKSKIFFRWDGSS